MKTLHETSNQAIIRPIFVWRRVFHTSYSISQWGHGSIAHHLLSFRNKKVAEVGDNCTAEKYFYGNQMGLYFLKADSYCFLVLQAQLQQDGDGRFVQLFLFNIRINFIPRKRSSSTAVEDKGSYAGLWGAVVNIVARLLASLRAGALTETSSSSTKEELRGWWQRHPSWHSL